MKEKNLGFKRKSSVATAAAAKSRTKRQAAPLKAADPTTTEREYSPEEAELLSAMSDYQKRTGRRFPTYCEVLAIVKGLGYAKHVPALS